MRFTNYTRSYMKRNNLWNRIFHKKEILLNKERFSLNKELINSVHEILSKLKKATELPDVLKIHKEAYALGFNCPELDVDEHGMFRAKSIQSMNEHQVFLGNTYGLVTAAIAYWEKYRNEPYGINSFGVKEDYPLYDIILNQYKHHLRVNIENMIAKATKENREYELRGYR